MLASERRDRDLTTAGYSPSSESSVSNAARHPAAAYSYCSSVRFPPQDVDTVTLVGYMTNNCDLASAAGAEELGFDVEIISDATGAIHLANAAGKASAEDVHNTLMALFNSNFAAVATTDAWIEATAAGAGLDKDNLVNSAIEGRNAFGA